MTMDIESGLKHTALYSLHKKLGAKMIAFAGYEMPQQYSPGIIKEHLHCRQHAGFFDISHMGQCQITGENVATSLEQLLPSDIEGLKTGQMRYSVLCNAQAGIVDDVIVSKNQTGFNIIVNAGCKNKDFNFLAKMLPSNCRLEILSEQALFALQGPDAHSIMQQLSPLASKLKFMQFCQSQIAEVNCQISRCGYTGEDGFEISVAKTDALKLANHILTEQLVWPIGLGARDSLRLEAGLSLYDHELNESISPVEAGLKWIIRKPLKDFIAADIVNRQLNQGTETKRVCLLVEGKIPVRPDTQLFTSDQQLIGMISSGGFSPCLKQPIALAQINSNCHHTELYAKVRTRLIELKLTSSPFIPHRYYR